MNKKGYYRFSDIGMFFISFAIIAVGVTIGIYMFYSQNLDVRDDEVKILFEKLKDAIFEDGKLKKEVLESNFNIYNEANLNFTFTCLPHVKCDVTRFVLNIHNTEGKVTSSYENEKKGL